MSSHRSGGSNSIGRHFVTNQKQQRLDDEIDCLINIVECLTSLLRKFSSIKLENQDVEDLMPSIKQTMECFSLSITLLESDLDASRIETIVFENCAEYVATLLGFSAIPIFRDALTQKNQSLIMKVRVEALQTLSKFVTICASVTNDPEERLSKMCVESIVENQGLEALLNMLQADETDALRLSISEFFFILVVKNPMGKLALVIQRAIPVLLNCLNHEPYGKVRNFLCAILREFAGVYPEELLKENMIGIASRLINVDASADVRALAAEILEILFKNDERALELLGNGDDSELPQILSHRLLKDQNREVLESVCKLLETLFINPKCKEFMGKFIEIGGYASFIRVLKQCSVRPASLAVRALRYLIQNADHDTYLGYKITTHFPSLSVLLKAVLKQSNKQPSAHKNEQVTIAHKLLRVELAICLGIIFAKNPSSRRYVYNELKAFPLWMSTLRSAMLKHLSLAELEYFSDVQLVDASGVNLMDAFNDDAAHHDGPAIKFVFNRQEKRFTPNTDVDADSLPGAFTINPEPASSRSQSRPKQADMETEEQIGKIKSFIIIYAVHLTLTPNPEEDNKQEKQQNYQDMESLEEEEYHRQDLTESHMTRTPPVPHQQSARRISSGTYKFSATSSPPVHHNSASARSPHRSPPAATAGVSMESPRLRELSAETRNDLKLNLSSLNQHEGESTNGHANVSHQKYDTPQRGGSTNGAPRTPGARSSTRSASKPRTPGRTTSARKRPRKTPRKSLEDIRFEHGIHLVHLFAEFHEEKVQAKQSQPLNSPYRTLLYRKFHNTTKNPHAYQLRSYSKMESPKKLQKSWGDDCVQLDDLFFFEIPLEDFRLELWQKVLRKLKRHHKNIKKKFITCPQARNGRGRRTFLMDMNKNVMPRIGEVISEFTSLVEHHGVEQIRITAYLWRGKNKSVSSVHNENIIDALEFVRDHIAKSQNVPSVEREDLDSSEIDRRSESGSNMWRTPQPADDSHHDNLTPKHMPARHEVDFSSIDRENILKAEIDVEPDFDDDDEDIVNMLRATPRREPEVDTFEKSPEKEEPSEEREPEPITPQQNESEPRIQEEEVIIESETVTKSTVQVRDSPVAQSEMDSEAQQLAELERHVQELEEKQRSQQAEKAQQQNSASLRAALSSKHEPNQSTPPQKRKVPQHSSPSSQRDTVSTEKKEEEASPEKPATTTPDQVQEEEASPAVKSSATPQKQDSSPQESHTPSTPAPEEMDSDNASNTESPDVSQLSIRERINLRKKRRKALKESPSVTESETSSRASSPADKVRERLAQRRRERSASPSSPRSEVSSPRSTGSIRDRVRERIAARRDAKK